MSNEEHHYLLAHQTSSGILESHLRFTNNMSFRPSDLKSDTHRNLTAQIADKHVRKTRTKMYMTEQDPERVKHEAEMVRLTADCLTVMQHEHVLNEFHSGSKNDYVRSVSWIAQDVVLKIGTHTTGHYAMITKMRRLKDMAAATSTMKTLWLMMTL
jgi:formamidopyrimidine-DNA glycosylase